MILRWAGRLVAGLALVCGLMITAPAYAASGLECKEAPTPDVPGTGMTGFFDKPPKPPPPKDDPFAAGSSTTIYEEYGFAGLRWHSYDLGCGSDATASPDAVIGTALSNWAMNLPITFTALTGAVTDVAFQPAFLDVFDPLIEKVSSTLYLQLFADWAPLLLTLVGFLLLFRARHANLASSAAAVGWAAIVLLIAATLFRWPVHAGNVADETVTSSLGAVVRALNGSSDHLSPGDAVSSSAHEAILYHNWLVGELGTADSATARKYGPLLFDAQALTWREAAILESDPEAGKEIVDGKRDRYGELAEEIKESDPVAYEHLTGQRADTRIGYAMLSTVAILLALPFLLIASLLLLGSFVIVRLAVMLFPALAVLGLFPPARGVLVSTFRIVGAALVNAMLFGVGAAVTIAGIGVILDPGSGLPGWLAVVLLPLFTFTMWFVLKPIRSLMAMTHANADPTRGADGLFDRAKRRAGSATKSQAEPATSSAAPVTTVAVNRQEASARADREDRVTVPDRVEARPTPPPAPVSDPAPVLVTATVQLPAGAVTDAPVAEASSSPLPLSRPDMEPLQQAFTRAPLESTAATSTNLDGFDGEQSYAVYRPRPPRCEPADGEGGVR